MCNFKGPVQSYLLSARTGICKEEVGESEQAEGRVGSGAWVALVVGALIKKEAEPLLFLSKACSNQKIALYCFPYKITLFHMLSKAIKMLVAKLFTLCTGHNIQAKGLL